MRHRMVIVRSVFVRLMVMRLMDVLPIRLVVLRRTYIVSRFGPIRLVVVRMLRRSLVTAVVSRVMALWAAVMFVPMILRATVMVVIVPVLCVSRSACCESKS
jgi:hypothetical protein